MESWIHLTVRGLVAVYLLCRSALFLLGKKRQNLWVFLTPKTKKKTDVSPATHETELYSIVGKSQTMYLKDIPQKKTIMIEPAFSEDLQLTPAYEEEPDVMAADVEDSLNTEDLSEGDRFLPLETVDENGGVSTGMTFEQLSDTFDVVRGKQTGVAGLQAAARILYEIRGSDLFDFLVAQAENEQVIEQMFKENLDVSGKPLPESGRKRRNMEAFDMDKYV